MSIVLLMNHHDHECNKERCEEKKKCVPKTRDATSDRNRGWDSNTEARDDMVRSAVEEDIMKIQDSMIEDEKIYRLRNIV